MASRIQIRRDSAASWTSANPILAQGELGVELDTNKFKVGNGTSDWNSLAYLISTSDYISGVPSSVDNEIALFSGTGGKTLKRATTSGVLKATSGVLSAATAGTDYVAPGTSTTYTSTQNFAANGITLKGTSTGVTTFASANTGAGNYTITFPAASDTVVTLAGNQTVSAKTFTSSTWQGNAVAVQYGGTGATSLTGLLKGNGTSAFTAATAGTDYVAPGTSTTFTAAQVFNGQVTVKEVKDTVFNITDAAGFQIDPANGSIQTVTLGASRTPAATNFEVGQCVLLGIDGGSAFSITWSTINPTWVKAGGTASAPSLATTGYTWILLWMVGTTMYAAEVGKP